MFRIVCSRNFLKRTFWSSLNRDFGLFDRVDVIFVVWVSPRKFRIELLGLEARTFKITVGFVLLVEVDTGH